MSDKSLAGSDAVAPDEVGPRRDQLRLLDTSGTRGEGGVFQALRDQRSAVPVGDPPSGDVPGLIGATGLEALDDDALLGRLEQINALEAMLAAERAATLAATAARISGVSADLGHDQPRPGDRAARGAERRWHNGLLRSISDETGLAMGLQRRSASRRIITSIDLVTRFPTTLHWLSEGWIPERAALAVAAELGSIQDPATRRRVEDKVLTWVDRYGPMRVKQVARRETAKVNPEDDAMKHEARLDQRRVQLRPLDSGCAELAMDCSAIHAAAVMNSLSKAAIQCRRKGDDRTLDQLRTDIAIHRLLGSPTTPSPTHPADSDQSTGHSPPDGTTSHPSHTSPADPASGQPADPRAANPPADQSNGDSPHSGDTSRPASPAIGHPSRPHDATRPASPADDQRPRGDANGPPKASSGQPTHVRDTRPAQAPSDHATSTRVGGHDGHAGGLGAARIADGLCGPERPYGTEAVVQAEIVIHCTAAEAQALATGSYATGGDLDGYGPLPQPALWDAFRTAKIRYRLTDREPIGDPNRYTPSTALAQHITDRDRTCQAPGCSQPAIRCDIDHRTEHPHGKTTTGNCAALCRHHHRLKHRGGWNLQRLPNGEHTWTTPTGRIYLVPPPIADLPSPDE